jgi:hypothetical protein
LTVCSYFRGEKIKFDVMEGVLRVATKYTAQSLRQEAISIFLHDFPATLKEWDALVASKSGSAYIMKPESAPKKAWYLRAVTLARECDVPLALPLAFYRLATYVVIERLWEMNGVLLTPSDTLACIAGKAKLKDRLLSINTCYLLPNGANGEEYCGGLICEDFRTSKMAVVLSIINSDKEMGLYKAFRAPCIITRYRVGDKPHDMCKGCRQKCVDMFAAARASFWEDLPSFFGLHSWNRLAGEGEEPSS